MLSGLWIDSNSQIPAKAPGLLSEECRVVSDGIGSEANKTWSARKVLELLAYQNLGQI